MTISPKKITELPAAGSVATTHLIPTVETAGPTTQKATVSQLATTLHTAPIFTGTTTVMGSVLYQGTRVRILSIPAEVQTSDDTVTTLLLFTMADETMCAFDVIVTAAQQTNVIDGGRWKRSVVYYRTSAGIATIVGTLESGTDQEISAGLDVTIDTNGANDVRVRVTGLAATSINWACELRVQETLATP